MGVAVAQGSAGQSGQLGKFFNGFQAFWGFGLGEWVARSTPPPEKAGIVFLQRPRLLGHLLNFLVVFQFLFVI